VCPLVSFWIGQDDGKLRIVQPFAAHGDMCDHMTRLRAAGKWTLHAAVLYMLDAAQGLQHIHGQPTPIIHRDIKLDNLLVTEENVAQLADFGVAAMVPAGTGARGVAGSPLTMAPETMRSGDAVVASDVWSLGVVCFHLLAGDQSHYPFWHDGAQPASYADLLRLIDGGSVNWSFITSFAVPVPLRALIARMLSNTPGSRPSAQQIVTELRLILDDIPAPLGYEHSTIQRSPLAAALVRFHMVSVHDVP